MQKLAINILDHFKNGLSFFKETFDIHSFSIGLDVAFFLSLLIAGSYLCLIFIALAVIKIIGIGYFKDE